jgi:hypothetical protein
MGRFGVRVDFVVLPAADFAVTVAVLDFVVARVGLVTFDVRRGTADCAGTDCDESAAAGDAAGSGAGDAVESGSASVLGPGGRRLGRRPASAVAQAPPIRARRRDSSLDSSVAVTPATRSRAAMAPITYSTARRASSRRRGFTLTAAPTRLSRSAKSAGDAGGGKLFSGTKNSSETLSRG